MDGWLDGWLDGWMVGWMDGWMDQYLSIKTPPSSTLPFGNEKSPTLNM